MSPMPPGIYTIHDFMAVSHVLVDKQRNVVLLDVGLAVTPWQIPRLLNCLGLGPGDVKAILLTHGHLDHVGGLAWAKAWCGAPIYAHPQEQAHIDGTYPYRGVSQWCGKLEALGRRVLKVGKSVKIDVPLAESDELPFWDGLRVVHLPGHTVGHCGFYSAKHDLLFSGDLFASYFFNVHLPAPFLNAVPHLIPESLEKVKCMNPRLLVPQHYDRLGALHRQRFDRMLARIERRKAERLRRVV